MLTVFAFDRDHTISVNPHPVRPSVPLGWVVALRDHEETAVWAIGNQRLTHEARIPGVYELESRLGHRNGRVVLLGVLTWLDGLLPEVIDRFMFQSVAARIARVTMPARRERLRLLEALYPDADDYIVIDDEDLSDLDGWRHFYPWEFYREYSSEFE